ncbi:STAS domain-containing protein [Cellulomonas sp. Marseille-Q8402]
MHLRHAVDVRSSTLHPASARPPASARVLAEARSACGTVQVLESDGALDVRFTGELDFGMRTSFDDVVDAVAAAGRAAELDCREVTFCGAEGVRMLVRLRDAAGTQGVRLSASGCVRRALALCGDPIPVRAARRAVPVRGTGTVGARVRPV